MIEGNYFRNCLIELSPESTYVPLKCEQFGQWFNDFVHGEKLIDLH